MAGKIFAVALSGGSLIIFSWFLWGTFSVLITWKETMEAVEIGAVLYGKVCIQSGKWMLGGFLTGSFWALVGGIAAAVMNHKHMAYATPFIMYYIMAAFQKRYYKEVYILDPAQWSAPENTGSGQMYIWVIVLVLCAGFLYGRVMEMRLKNV